MTLTAVLFAGGLSPRMGVDKATHTIAGEQLWARQLRVLNGLQPDAFWISARTMPAWCPPEIKTVLDEPPSRGPMSGLRAALQSMRTSHLLTLAVDLPQMSTIHLLKLKSLARPGCGVVRRNGDFLEVLCAIYPVEAAVIAESTLVGTDASLQNFARLLMQHGCAQTCPLDETEKPLYHNVNTPADMKKTTC